MALRIASRRASAVFVGSGSQIHRRNAIALSIPTSTVPDEIRQDTILVRRLLMLYSFLIS